MAGIRKPHVPPMPDVDENWWASVLAEESRQMPPATERQRSGQRLERTAGANHDPAPAIDWPRIQQVYHGDEIVTLKVTGHNRGGLLVGGDGLSGFVPLSHLVDLANRSAESGKPGELSSYLGDSLRLKVIECVPEEGRVVFSERAALAQPGQRSLLFGQLKVGQTVNGTVTNTTDFGAFVDLGGVEGLIHISELSWGRVTHPSQIVHVGESLQVRVLELAPERCRVALSLKRLLPNPWEHAAEEFPVGGVLQATVTTVLSYGAFARLDAGVEGLIHVSEMPLPSGQAVRDWLVPGQSVTVRVLHLDPLHQRMGLSMLVEAGKDTAE